MPKLTNITFRPSAYRETRTVSITLSVNGYKYGEVASQIYGLNHIGTNGWKLKNKNTGETLAEYPDLAALMFAISDWVGADLTKRLTSGNDYHDYGNLMMNGQVVATYQDTPPGKLATHKE